MPISLDSNLLRTKASPRIDALNCNNKLLLIWWYCGVLKNRRDQYQPLAKIAVRTQISEDIYSDHISYRSVPIEYLGQLRIGSLCKKNRVIARAQFQEKDFEVLHSIGDFWFTSFDSAARKEYKPPFPQAIYPLRYERDKNWMVCFRLDNGGHLLIPTLEYFTRCYGRSGKLRRYLTTHKLLDKDDIEETFFSPTAQPEEPGKWKINIKKGFYQGDSAFLAHLKYDPYTQRAVKYINSDIERQFAGDIQVPAFPKIGPWFKGPSKLRARGIPFNGGRSFLGLQITGLLEPQGDEIDAIRDNRNNAIQPAGSDAPGKAWSGTPIKRPIQPPEILDLTAYETPDQGSVILELEDPEVVHLGPRRAINNIRDEQATDKRGGLGFSSESNALSSSDPHGTDKDINQASIHTPEVTQAEMESEGALRDIWNAAQHLKQRYKRVSKVEWYTPSKGFNENSNPHLISVRPFEDHELIDGFPIDTQIRKWPYLDPVTREILRGLLVIRLTIDNRNIYIVEAQRRMINSLNKEGRSEKKEESLRGMVFTLDSEIHFGEWLSTVRSDIRVVQGIVQNLTSNCPGEADTFNHVSTAKDEVPLWGTIHNALKKVDITLQ